MYEILSLLSVILGVAYFLFYCWHLTWSTVEAKVLSSYIHEMPSVVSSNRRFKIVNYEFDYNGKVHTVNRQSLFMRFGFAQNVLVGDKVPVKVCPIIIDFSCPDRKLFNFLILVCFQVFFAGLVAVFMTAG